MIRFTTARIVMWAAFLTAGYFLLAKIVTPTLLLDVINGAFLGVLVAVFIVYSPLVWDSLWNSKFDRVSQLSIGIGLLWLSIGMTKGWEGFIKYSGNPACLANHPLVGYIAFVAVCAGSLFVTAPGYHSTATPIPFGGGNRKLLLIFGALGAFVALVLHFY